MKKKLDKSKIRALEVQAKNSKNIEKIDFDKYDLIISFKDTVSSKAITKYRKPLGLKFLRITKISHSRKI